MEIKERIIGIADKRQNRNNEHTCWKNGTAECIDTISGRNGDRSFSELYSDILCKRSACKNGNYEKYDVACGK